MADVINMFDYFTTPQPPDEPMAQVINIADWMVA